MTKQQLSGLLLDDECYLTLNEICQACMTQTEWVIELVEEGILEPAGSDVDNWRFSGPSLSRARTVHHLQHDLGVNMAGAALVLDPMEEVKLMRERLSMQERHY